MKATDKKIIIIASATLIIGLLLGWLLFGNRKSNFHNQQKQTTTKATKETIWTCSMHPQIRQNEPGDCPICGMDLIPLEEEENEGIDPNAIRMSPTAMQLANVSTAIVEEMGTTKKIQLTGKVKTDERLVNSQASHIPGRIEKLLVNFTGEFVKKGQTIAYIYSPDLATAQEELLEAQKIADDQPELFEAAKGKLKNWKLSDRQIQKILSTGSTQTNFPIIADISGYITSKNVNLGDYVKRGEPIYEIANLSKVWILFDVYESEMSWIKKGDEMEFTIASLPGEVFNGTISFIDPVIDSKTRVAKARVEFNNQNGQLKPEMFASGIVKSKLPKQSNAIVVPKTAVMWTGKRSVVYVKSSYDKGVNFSLREVTLGAALGDSYVVKDGLMKGEEIATNGTFSIDAAAQLAGKPSMMSPEDGTDIAEENHENHSVSSISISSKAKKALQPLYTSYFKWKDALADDNFEDSQQYATGMKYALEDIDMKLFKDDAHHTWMTYQENISENLEHVEHTKDIEQLRKIFQLVSNAMIEMTTTFHPNDDVIYVQHCPMADNNNGADWLSKEEEILNPYFGDMMLNCGEVTQEIK